MTSTRTLHTDPQRTWRVAAVIGAAVLIAAIIVGLGVAVVALSPGSMFGNRSSADGPGTIANSTSGLCIDANGPPYPGVRLRVDDCANYSGEIWTYNPSTTHFTNPSSGLCLDTVGAPTVGARLVLHRCGNFTGQHWNYVAGTGRIINVISGLCLDTDGAPNINVALVLNVCGNYSGQTWHR